MKFAFCGYDYLSCAFEALVNQGYTAVELFTHPMDGVYDSCQKVTAIATRVGCPIHTNRITTDDVERLKERGVEVLISAAYPFRIPAKNLGSLMAVNLHPSMLPIGRGPQPLFQTILKGLSTSAATLHKISQEFDQGEIIL